MQRNGIVLCPAFLSLLITSSIPSFAQNAVNPVTGEPVPMPPGMEFLPEVTTSPFTGSTLEPYICFETSRQEDIQDTSTSSADPQDQLLPSPFFSKTRFIDVRFPNASPEISRLFTTYVLYALRLWGLACSNCEALSAAVVRINGDFWILERYPGAIDQVTSFGPTIPAGIPQVGDPVGQTTLAAALGGPKLEDYFGRLRRGGDARSNYVPLSSTNPVLQRFCETGHEEVDQGLAQLHSILCEDQAPDGNYSFMLVEGKTFCQEDDAIACTLPQEGVQLSLEDFSFTAFADPNTVVLGDGSRKVDLFSVFLHETGHWIGLTDVPVSRDPDLMSASYHSNMCMSDQNVDDVVTMNFTGAVAGNPSALIYVDNN